MKDHKELLDRILRELAHPQVDQTADPRLLQVAQRMGVPVFYAPGRIIMMGPDRGAIGYTDTVCWGPQNVQVKKIVIVRQPNTRIDFVLAHELGHALDALTTPALYFLASRAVSYYGGQPESVGGRMTLMLERRAWEIGKRVLDFSGVEYEPEAWEADIRVGLKMHDQNSRLLPV